MSCVPFGVFSAPPPLSPTEINVSALQGNLTGNSGQITVVPDWFSNNIPDIGIQDLARTDFLGHTTHGLTYDDMLGLFTLAENEESNDNDATATTSLQTLVNDGGNSNVNMPAAVQYLASQVVNPSSSDVTFLAQYYYDSDLAWTVTVANPSAGGEFDLTVELQDRTWAPFTQNVVSTGFLASTSTAAQIQSALQGLSNVGSTVTVSSNGPGVYTVVFSDPYTTSLTGAILSGGSTLTINSAENAGAAVPVAMANGQPVFGDGSGSPWVAWTAQTKALVNQWFLGTVYPDSYDGPDSDPPSPYTTPSGTPSLYEPTGVPLATDVLQGGDSDCYLMASLADVAYIDPTMIENMITDNGNGTYTIRYYESQTANPGNPVYVTVDNKLPNGGAVFDNPQVSGSTVLWAALAEKAYAELRFGDYSYADLSGSSSTHALAVITGRPAPDTAYNPLPATTDSFDATAANALSQGQFVTLGCGRGPLSWRPPTCTRCWITIHRRNSFCCSIPGGSRPPPRYPRLLPVTPVSLRTPFKSITIPSAA